MIRFYWILFISVLLFPLSAYTPADTLQGHVKSIRTYKELLRDIPAGTMDEPWFLNCDYDEKGRTVSQWYYEMGGGQGGGGGGRVPPPRVPL